MKRMPRAGMLLAGLVILAAAVPAVGQEVDERLMKLAEDMKAQLEAGLRMHMGMDMAINLNDGQFEQEMSMEMWQDGMSVRVEMPTMNMIIIATPEEIYIWQGQAGVALYAPPETMKQLTEKRDEVFKKLGLPTDPAEMYVAMIEMGALKITGEETVDGHECYSIEVDDTMMDAMMEMGQSFMPMAGAGGGMPPGMEFSNFSMALDKEMGYPRKMDIDMSVTPDPQNPDIKMNIAIGMKMTTIETGVEIPEELFSFEVPEDDDSVVMWTPDKTADQIQQEFQQAIMKGVQAGGGGQ